MTHDVVDPSVLFTCRGCGKPDCVNMGDGPFCSWTCRMEQDARNEQAKREAAAAPPLIVRRQDRRHA